MNKSSDFPHFVYFIRTYKKKKKVIQNMNIRFSEKTELLFSLSLNERIWPLPF